MYCGALAFTLVPVRLKLAPVGSGKPATPLLRMQAVKRVMVAVTEAGTFRGGRGAPAALLGETAGVDDRAAEVAGCDLDSEEKAAVSTGWHFARAPR